MRILANIFSTVSMSQVIFVHYLQKGVDIVYESVGGEIFDICVDR